MAKFILSAFSDEYASDFDKQLEGLRQNGITHMEIRGVNGKNILSLTDEEVAEVRAKLDASGIQLSSIGSPLGKISITDPMEPHLEMTRRAVQIAKALGTRNIRMFSFYIPDGKYAEYRNEVISRLAAMCEIAEAEDIFLCHENEKGIYGDNADRCLDLQNALEGRLKCIFDPANFIQCHEQPYPHAFDLLGKKIYYMHIKDALEDGTVVPAGKGIGGLPEILAQLKKNDQTYFLTLEPHLRVFAGLEALENGEKTKMTFTYSSGEEAFGAASDALKDILNSL